MQTHNDLIKRLIDIEALKTPRIIDAFRRIDRACFVLPDHKDIAYEDYPLTIGYGATISQPYTVAFMFELLQPKPGEKILDVGSGSAWTTALLSQIVGVTGKVFGVEIVPELVEFGKSNLKNYNFPQTQIVQATEELGLTKEAPFDKILVSAASWDEPKKLIMQLKPLGKLVTPIRNSIWQIDKLADETTASQEFPGFTFVPLK